MCCIWGCTARRSRTGMRGWGWRLGSSGGQSPLAAGTAPSYNQQRSANYSFPTTWTNWFQGTLLSIKTALAKKLTSLDNFFIKGLHAEIVKSVRVRTLWEPSKVYRHPTINDNYERNCQLRTQIFLWVSFTSCLWAKALFTKFIYCPQRRGELLNF